jgi:uncharacterized membrane protein YdjX (TVP38/TMEM64 family)
MKVVAKLLKQYGKLLIVLFMSIGFIFALYYFLKSSGIIGKFSNVQELQTLILSAGFWSIFVYFLLQFLQVTIIPLPSSVTTIVGVLLFGPYEAFVVSLIAIISGSITAYFLGKILGIKLLVWAVGKEQTFEIQKLFQKGKFMFFVMMLFPFFPDDLLCMFAGVCKMDFKFFIATNIVTRTIGLFCLCFLSNFALFKIFMIR